MTLFMPPIQRKKKVDDKYCPDSFRVISEDAISDHPKYKPLPYRASFEPRTPTPKVLKCNENQEAETCFPAQPLKSTRVLPKVLPDYRGNKPQPLSCGFLDKNVRFLNEPICNVYTKPVQHEEKRWWPSRPNPGDLVVPPYAEDTNYRTSFSCKHGERHTGSGRHTAHTDRETAKGIIPVNYLRGQNDEKRLYKEGLSYEHMYNCRDDPNYPIRGKRHGAFVWDRMDPLSQKKFIEYYQRLDEEERKFEEMKKLSSAQSTKARVSCTSNKVNGDTSPNKTSPTAYTNARLVCEGQKNTNDNCSLVHSDKPSEIKAAECSDAVNDKKCDGAGNIDANNNLNPENDKKE